MSDILNPAHLVQRFFTQFSSHLFGVKDDQFAVVDGGDTTKRAQFSVGGLTTATTRTYTLPDYDLTLGGAGNRQPVLVGASNLTLGATQSGCLIACGAGEDFVLPAITAVENGLRYEFLIITTATNFTITTATGDFMIGGATICSTTATENDSFSADGTTHLSFSMNGTTQGGIVGSYVRVQAFDATRWVVRGDLIGSGTLVTPFGT